MAAVNGALSGSQGLSGGWLTVAQQNSVIGYPNNPEWPGPIPDTHGPGAGPLPPGRDGLSGQAPPPIPVVPGPQFPDLSGGQITDTVVETFGEHGAPMAPAFSQAEPFAPPGPIIDTHGYDTGGVERTEHVPVVHAPGWFRRVLTGQTYNRQSYTTTPEGWDVSAVNGRQDLDQYQGQNANAYDPFTIPYSERPIKANFAAEAFPIASGSGAYYPDGHLADMAGLGGQGNYGYTTPPDPAVITDPSVTAGQQVQASPLTGLEFLNYG